MASPSLCFFAGAIARSLFRCRSQTLRVAENVGDGAFLPMSPIPAIPYRAGAGQFYVPASTTSSSPTTATSPSPWALVPSGPRLVPSLRLSLSTVSLDGDSGAPLVVPMGATRESFDSGWFTMVSQSLTQSYVEGVHGIDAEPEGLQVSVRVRAIDGPNNGFVFNGMGVGVFLGGGGRGGCHLRSLCPRRRSVF